MYIDLFLSFAVLVLVLFLVLFMGYHLNKVRELRDMIDVSCPPVPSLPDISCPPIKCHCGTSALSNARL